MISRGNGNLFLKIKQTKSQFSVVNEPTWWDLGVKDEGYFKFSFSFIQASSLFNKMQYLNYLHDKQENRLASHCKKSKSYDFK